MGTQLKNNILNDAVNTLQTYVADSLIDPTEAFYDMDILTRLPDLLKRLSLSSGKQSFLVFKHNKYFSVATKNIAFIYLKYECTIITCFDGQEYVVNHSLEQVQQLLAPQHFFRLNRQYLINFYAVKEVEHFFARKLFVQLTIASPDKLLVSKEKVGCFLHWLDNR